MAHFTIASRKLGPQEFRCSDAGGYVYLVSDGPRDDRQICDGGGFMGSTLRASAGTLEAVARSWHRQRLERMREFGV